MMNEFNPDGKDIRFIDSHYRDLFRIPDGGTIQVHYSDDSVVIKPCKFIDEYHTQIGNNVFHICQFAELLERNGSYCQAEPEIMGDEAAWQVGRDQYLAIQTCEDGYDYTLFDKEFHEIDGGQLDNPELSMLEARAEILAGFGLQMRELRVQVYEEVMEKAEAVEAVNASLLDLAKQIDQFTRQIEVVAIPLFHRAGQNDRLGDFLDSRINLAAGFVVPLHIENIQGVRFDGNLIQVVADPVELPHHGVVIGRRGVLRFKAVYQVPKIRFTGKSAFLDLLLKRLGFLFIQPELNVNIAFSHSTSLFSSF